MLTLDKYKRFLGIATTETGRDTQLNEFIADAVGEAKRATNRKQLHYGLVQVYIDGSGTNELILPEFPVASVTVLKYWNGTEYTDIVTASGDTISNSLIIVQPYKIALNKGYTFPEGSNNIYAEFYAGYLWADAWAASKAYVLDNLAIYNSTLYKCTTAHTSASTFDATKWEAQTVEVIPADLEKAVKYNAAMIFYESPAGMGWFMKQSSNVGGAAIDGFSISKDKMVDYYTATYNYYRKRNI